MAHVRACLDGPPLKSSTSPAPAWRGIKQDATSITQRTSQAAINGGLRALYRTLELPGAKDIDMAANNGRLAM
jgi:hypothetical protein